MGVKDILIKVQGDNKDFNAAMTDSSASMRAFGATTMATTGAAATGLTALTGAVVGQTAMVASSAAIQATTITGSQQKIRTDVGLTVDEVKKLSKELYGDIDKDTKFETWEDAAEEFKEASKDLDKGIDKAQKVLDDYAKAVEKTKKKTKDLKTVTERYRQAQEKLNKSLKTAKSKMAAFGASIKKAAKKLAIAGAAILATAYAVGKLTAKSIEYANILDKVNAQTGIAIEDLSAYGYAAGQSAVEFNDLTEAIKDLNDRVYDAHEGNVDLLETFDNLGVSIYDSAGYLKDSKTIFEEVGTAIGNIEDPAAKTNISMKLMADNGYKMIPIFNDMNQFIETTDFAKLEGLVMSESDVQRLRDVDKQYGSLKTTVSTMTNELALDLLPTVEAVLSLLQWGAENVLPGVARAIQVLSVPLRIIIDSFRIVALAAEAAWYAAKGDFKEVEAIRIKIGYLVADQLKDNAEALWNRDRETEAIKEAGTALKGNLQTQRDIADATKAAASAAEWRGSQPSASARMGALGSTMSASVAKMLYGEDIPGSVTIAPTSGIGAIHDPPSLQPVTVNITTGDIVDQGGMETFKENVTSATIGSRSGV